MQAIALRSLVLLTVSVHLAAQAPRALPQSLEAALPASTYAAVSFGGLARCHAAADALPLAAAVHAFLAKVPAEVRAERLDEHLEQATRHVQEALGQAGLRPADVRAFLGQPMTLAIGRMSIEGMGPSVALLVEIGDKKAAINRVVQWCAQRLGELAGGAEGGEVAIGDARFHSMTMNEGPVLFAGAIGRYYVASNSRGYLRDLVDVANGRTAGLGQSTRLVQLQGQLPAPALAALFVNADRVCSAFAPHLPYEAEQWSAALGLGAVDALYAATTAGADGGSDLWHLGVGGSERGLLKALVAAPVDLAFAQSCSANTVAFGAGSFDVGAFAGAFHRFAELLPAAARGEMMEELERGIGEALAEFGSSPDEAHKLMAAFGTQLGMALALEKGAVPKPEMLVRIAVRDPQVVAALLQQLEGKVSEQSGLEWKTRKADDHEVRFVNLPLPEAKLQLSPCYVVTKDSLWLGSDAQALVRALRQDPAASLAAQPDFQALATQSKGASGVMHLRLFRAAEIGWRTVETMAYPQLDAHQDEVGFGSDALPDSETMAKALGTSSWVWTVDDAGVTVQSRGTFTFGSLLAAFGACGDEVLGRAGAKVY
ncbi:MAG: hypothetical protein WAT39_25575 [Planctomycetota bacterium]